MDKVFIYDLKVNCIIGVYDWERQKPQEITINLVLFTDLSLAGKNDDLAGSPDYEKVAQDVHSFVEQSKRMTVEALATDIAQVCLGYPGVKRTRVRVDKPGAVQFTRSVGVEIEREHTDFLNS